MKRLSLALILILCLLLAGCRKAAPAPDPAPAAPPVVTPAEPSPEPTPEPAPAPDPEPASAEMDSEALAALRAAAREAGSLCAFNFVGYDYDTFSPAFDVQYLPDVYPSNGWMNYFDADGDEVYVLTPADPAAAVKVERLVFGEDAELHVTETLFTCGGEAPLILRCNVSDIMPNVLVTVTDGAGNTLSASPTISLRDGRAEMPGGFDATHYPEGMEFEGDGLPSETGITADAAYEGVLNYCREAYDWSVAENNPSIMYVAPGEESETEYQVIFRSYTGALVYFYVDKASGVTRMTEYVPDLGVEHEAGEISIFDYLEAQG